jgi:hypothetical protein
MKRIKIVGLCLVATFAMSAMVAASAHAGQYEECVKQSKNPVTKKYEGKYLDKSCNEEASEAQKEEGKHNKYERSPGVTAEHAGFTAKTKSAELVGAAGSIVCKKSRTAGTITGPKTNSEVVTFEKCEITGALEGECHSAAQAEGVIVTNLLSTTLIDHGEKGLSGGEPAEGEVWNQFTGPGGAEGIQAEYLCAGIALIRTKGSLSGVFTEGSLNVSSKKAEIEFEGEFPGGLGFGEQDLYSELSLDGGATWENIGPGVEKTKGKVKQAGKIVIRT